jgi:signal transduction histidine kinase
VDSFAFNRQTIAFLGVLGAVEVVLFLLFPLVTFGLGAIALSALVVVWLKAGIRSGTWLWWNPVAVPLTQVEGAVAVSAALMLSAGAAAAGYMAARMASRDPAALNGIALRYVLPLEASTRPAGWRSVHYSDPDRRQGLKKELEKAGIPFKVETSDGKEYVGWAPEHDAAAEEIQRKVRDAPFPNSHSVSFDDPKTQQEFRLWLVERRIPHQIVQMRGRDYIGWKDGPDDLAVQFVRERSAKCAETPCRSGGTP